MKARFRIDYGPDLEKRVRAIAARIEAHDEVAAVFPVRWLALQLLEDGTDLAARVATFEGGQEILDEAERQRGLLGEVTPLDPHLLIVDRRYEWINRAVQETTTRSSSTRRSRSDRIDALATSRRWGVPLFLLAMWVVFKLTADVSSAFLDWIDQTINGPIAHWAGSLIGVVGLGGTWVESLVVDGIIVGVGGILVFIPVLMTLYFALAILEDSGYMARVAFVMERTMRRVGLPGKSFLPMMVGFGCTVPAIYATRTLESRRDRILTGLLVPFMSCGARLPVYVLIATVFFSQQRGSVVFAMYLTGLAIALLLALVLSKTVFGEGGASELVMELPPYRLPTPAAVWFHMWNRTRDFIRNAGTLILATSMVVWLLMAIPISGGAFGDVPIADSAFAKAGQVIAPAFTPAGFGSWEATGSLATGFVAKEVVVSSMSQIFEVEDAGATIPDGSVAQDLGGIVTGFGTAAMRALEALPGIVGLGGGGESTDTGYLGDAVHQSFALSSGGHPAAAGLAFMVFVLLYTPCIAAVAAERHELGSRWMWTSVIGQTTLAWVVSVAVFQVARLVI